jgi:hypothetical protein
MLNPLTARLRTLLATLESDIRRRVDDDATVRAPLEADHKAEFEAGHTRQDFTTWLGGSGKNARNSGSSDLPPQSRSSSLPKPVVAPSRRTFPQVTRALARVMASSASRRACQTPDHFTRSCPTGRA